ncbi:MAG TPA: sigma-54 dependent transcriptional regulator [Thermoanaerobaculia bacterium]|nr:sigma-54 dependent transcriptional regulator [Thermoanaerobaculia bacterium]
MQSLNPWEEELDVSTMADGLREGPLPKLLLPALTILAHPNPRRIGERVLLPALASGKLVELSRLTPLFAAPGSGDVRPLADPHLSRQPIQLVPGESPGSVRISGGGPVEILRASSPGHLSASDIERGTVLILAERVALLLHLAHPAPSSETERFGLVGESAPMIQLRGEVRRVAGLGMPVLLRGETGTGKELVARALHEAGPRRGRPYLALNLGAVSPSLAASELFGAARGAFTGADRRRAGYFEQAHGGTLFLDEVGEAPPEVQVHLLRALESGEIQPVGAETPLRVDVRVVAATDADLETAVAEGRFRAPLIHRLNGCEIHLPPLRERRDDVGRLLLHFLREELAALGEESRLEDPGPRGQPWLPAGLVARLADYDWPGNVRELRNVARQIAAESREARQARLPPALERALSAPVRKPAEPRPERSRPGPRPAYRTPSEVGDEELLNALRASHWNLAEAASRLRLSRTSLYALIERCPAVRKASDLSRDEILAALDRHEGDLNAAAGDLRVSPHGLRIRRTELGIP